MKFISSREVESNNQDEQVSFAEALLHCIPKDGGMYVPAYSEDLRPWILYMNQATSFQSIAGSLTSALIRDEFSPLISEAIAYKAFPFSPELKQLDDNLYVLELFHGETGCYKDFAVSYLASCLEHILLMQDKKATVLAVTNGETGASIANAFKNKKNLKAMLLYTKGTSRHLPDECLIENGGNIFAVEVDGTEAECFELLRKIYSNQELVNKFSLTLANTVNIGRVLPMIFPYIYAFSRLKGKIYGDLFYAMDAGNYGNLVSGLYGWKFSLPVTGFITNCTDSLVQDSLGKCTILDSIVSLKQRNATDPANPSNLERLESVFFTNSSVIKGFVYPSLVTEKHIAEAAKSSFLKYNYFMDKQTAVAYAASLNATQTVQDEDGTVILLAHNHPSFSKDFIQHTVGEKLKVPEHLESICQKETAKNKILPTVEEVVKLLDRFFG